MHAHTPEEVHSLWSQAFAAGDVRALLALYEPGAVLAPSPAEPHAGPEAIRAVLEGFLGLRPTFEMAPPRVVRAGDVALLFADWHLDGTAQDGSPVHMEGTTADVVRRCPDGAWRMVIDTPFGGARAT